MSGRRKQNGRRSRSEPGAGYSLPCDQTERLLWMRGCTSRRVVLSRVINLYAANARCRMTKGPKREPKRVDVRLSETPELNVDFLDVVLCQLSEIEHNLALDLAS